MRLEGVRATLEEGSGRFDNGGWKIFGDPVLQVVVLSTPLRR